MAADGVQISAKDEFEAKLNLTKAFCETAKSYIQIGVAALALPLVFTQAVLGKNAAEEGLRSLQTPWLLYASWVCFLLTIGFGLLYQWMSIRRVWDDFHNTYRTPRNVSRPGYRQTWWVIDFRNFNLSGVWVGMTASFYVGAILFTVFAIRLV